MRNLNGRERRRRRRAERRCGSAIAREPAPTRTAKMSLDFSETYKRTGPTPVFSPDGRFLATAVEYRLVIRDAETLTVCSISSCLDRIHKIEWHPDSDHVLCACYKRGVVQCFSVSDEKWTCLIDEGPAGCVHARWSPLGTHILTVAEFNVRCSVWSLATSPASTSGSPNTRTGDRVLPERQVHPRSSSAASAKITSPSSRAPRGPPRPGSRWRRPTWRTPRGHPTAPPSPCGTP